MCGLVDVSGVALVVVLRAGGWYVQRTTPWRHASAPNELLQATLSIRARVGRERHQQLDAAVTAHSSDCWPDGLVIGRVTGLVA